MASLVRLSVPSAWAIAVVAHGGCDAHESDGSDPKGSSPDTAGRADSNGEDSATDCVTGAQTGGGLLTLSWCENAEYTRQFGAAETGSGVAGWYGEDCLLDPDDDRDGGYEVCHTFLPGVTRLELRVVDEPSSVMAGESTMLFVSNPEAWTWFLHVVDTGWCAAWGDDVSHYSSMGCTTP